ncbi:MAG TPA: hypothetical protein DEF45_17340 [Rhodopirellula sp.]|nr:hypothetical protein [Rhodopirellula sp.]
MTAELIFWPSDIALYNTRSGVSGSSGGSFWSIATGDRLGARGRCVRQVVTILRLCFQKAHRRRAAGKHNLPVLIDLNRF